MSNIPLIETVGLKTYFNTPKGKLHAVDDINIKIEEGKTLGVVGESGCGKSTLGRSILRMIEPTEGKILYKGKDITGLRAKDMKEIRRDLQLIFQDPLSSLNPRMSVSNIIAEPLRINKICRSGAEVEQRVNELMETVGLANRFANSYPHELDGGRRQRIGIARALAVNPKFIVCDEPVSALDVSIQAQVLNLLMDLQDDRGLTYMFITHDLSVVKHISSQIAVMYLGQCVELADTDALFEKQFHPYTKALLAAIPVPSLASRGKGLNVIKGEVSNPIDPPPGCRFASRCPYATDRCRKENPKMKEIEPGHFVACVLYEDHLDERDE